MSLSKEGHLLRIYIAENEKYKHHRLYEWIINEAQKQGLAGATVLRGMAGFIADDPMRHTKILRLSDNLPVVIEIVDSLNKIEAFIPMIEPAIKQGLITLEKVQVRLYKNE